MTAFTAVLLTALASTASAPAQPAAPVRTIETGYSFTRAPFVNPRILHEMGAWLSDTGDLVVAINLTDANDSNRFSTWGDEVEARESAGRCPFVWWRQAPEADAHSRESFGYRYIGLTDSGVQVLETASSGGGSGTLSICCSSPSNAGTGSHTMLSGRTAGWSAPTVNGSSCSSC